MFKDYYAVRSWLESFIPYTYSKQNLGLARISYLLKLLGNPQKKFKSVLVAGTSGKGSTAFYIAKLLVNSLEVKGKKARIGKRQVVSVDDKRLTPHETGCVTHKRLTHIKIGLHLSPHLVYIGERMQIFAGSQFFDPVSKNLHETGSLLMPKFLRLFDQIKPVVEKINQERSDLTPSYFEILVAASFKYFADQKVDWAVVEVGLGGRLDATNVLKPEICVITNVGLDHTDILGKSIEKIAKEKAGIIKEGVSVITGARGSALKVIKNVAKSKKAPLIKVNTQLGVRPLKSHIKDYLIIYRDRERYIPNSFASTNFLLGLAGVLALGFIPKKGAVLQISRSGLPGRFEEIDKDVILDGAHNVDKIRFLIHQLNTKYSIQNTQYTVVVAFKKGKNWKKMVDILVESLPVEKIIATKFYAVTDTGPTPSQRLRGVKFFASVEPEEITKYVNSKWRMVNGKSSDNSQAAVLEALNANSLDANQLILVTGSLYLVGEARTLWYLPKF